MVNGKIETRGTEVFEASIQKAKTVLVESGRATAESELREAIADLSRRPEPDLTGAIQHSMAALECIARDVCKRPSRTLGDLLQKEAQNLGIPKPLNEAVEKAGGTYQKWGVMSEKVGPPKEPRRSLLSEFVPPFQLTSVKRSL